MSRPVFTAVLLFAVSAVAPMARGQKVVGVVQSVRGDWIIQGTTEKIKPQHLINEGQVPFISHDTSGELTIALLATSEHFDKKCTPSAPCDGPYALHTPPQPPTTFWSFLKSYWNSEDKVPPIFAGSRGVESPGPRHSLLVIHDSRIDLTPALGAISSGAYRIVLKPQGSTAATPDPVTIQWSGASVTAPAPAPGLDVLDVFNAAGERQGTHAAALVVPASDLADQADWKNASASIAAATGSDAATADDLRLACLLALRDRSVR